MATTNKKQIKSFKDAAGYLKYPVTKLPKVAHLPKRKQLHVLVDFKIDIIIEAINKQFNGGKKWKPDYTNSDQEKRYIWWYYQDKKTGFRFSGTVNGWASSGSRVGPRLSFVSRAAAEYFASVPEFVKLLNQKFTV